MNIKNIKIVGKKKELVENKKVVEVQPDYLYTISVEEFVDGEYKIQVFSLLDRRFIYFTSGKDIGKLIRDAFKYYRRSKSIVKVNGKTYRFRELNELLDEQ